MREGYEEVCVDSYDPYYDPAFKRKNISIASKSENFELIKGDIRDGGSLVEIVREGNID